MLQTGAFHTLKVVAIDEQGAVLGSDGVRLPLAEAPAEGWTVGSCVRVFVSADTSGALVATTDEPWLAFGGFACLSVVDHNEHGAFVHWGLKKDLFVPNKEQPRKLLVGLKYCITLTLDAQGRVMGSARVEDYFERDVSGLKPGTPVQLLVYEFHDLGAKVLVDQCYAGMIYDDDIYRELEIGSKLTGFIHSVRADGKLDIRLRSSGRAGLDCGRDQLLAALERSGGYLPLHDKSSPDEIYETVQMSKKAFKRSVGILLKAGRLSIEDGGVRLTSARVS